MKKPVHDGDRVVFNGKTYTVEIQGYQGAYEDIDGVWTNRGTATEGYMRDETGHCFRASWGKEGLVHVE